MSCCVCAVPLGNGAARRAFARQRYNRGRIVVQLTEEYKSVIA